MPKTVSFLIFIACLIHSSLTQAVPFSEPPLRITYRTKRGKFTHLVDNPHYSTNIKILTPDQKSFSIASSGDFDITDLENETVIIDISGQKIYRYTPKSQPPFTLWFEFSEIICGHVCAQNSFSLHQLRTPEGNFAGFLYEAITREWRLIKYPDTPKPVINIRHACFLISSPKETPTCLLIDFSDGTSATFNLENLSFTCTPNSPPPCHQDNPSNSPTKENKQKLKNRPPKDTLPYSPKDIPPSPRG